MYIRRLVTFYLIEPKQKTEEEVAEALKCPSDEWVILRVVKAEKKDEYGVVFAPKTDAAGKYDARSLTNLLMQVTNNCTDRIRKPKTL